MHAPTRSLLLSLLLPTLSFAAHPPTQSAYTITPDHPDALYHTTDKVTFHLAGTPSPALTYKLTKDGFGPPISTGPVTTLPTDIHSSLNEPGFLRLELSDGSKTLAVASAGIDPDHIQPSLPPPADFDAFWSAQKDLLISDLPHPTLTPVPSPDSAIDTFDLQVNCPGGAPLSGYYAKPKSAQPRSLPAILFPHAAGVRSSSLRQAVHGAAFGCIALDFNAHGLPNGKPADFYSTLYNTTLNAYPFHGRTSRDTCYFRGMFLRLLRALDFLTSQPEWDGRTLIVYGSSQGGGQALIAAGLDPRVTLCLASVPALCDHTAFAAHRIPGWPKLVPHDANWNYDPKIAEVARYFDAMNFAPHIRAQTLVTVGFVDATVPPTSVYAAFNAIPSDKKILPQSHMSHEFPPPLVRTFDAAVRAHLAAQQSK